MKIIVFALTAVLLCACSGGGGSSSSAGAVAVPSVRGVANVTFRIELPTSTQPANVVRRPLYISLGMLSVVATLTAQSGSPVTPRPNAVNVSYTSGCRLGPASFARKPLARRGTLDGVDQPKICTFSVLAPVGVDTFTVATYDAVQTTTTPAMPAGHELSVGTVSTTIVADAANNVSVTLNAVVAALQIVVQPGSVVNAGLDVPLTIFVNGALDAAGDAIPNNWLFATPAVLSVTYGGMATHPGFYPFSPPTLNQNGGQVTTTYPGSNSHVNCNPPTFTATSGNVTATVTLGITQC